MPSPALSLLKYNRLLQVTGFSAVAAVLVGLAVIHPGVRSAEVDLNDGGVWVTNKSISMTARLNYPSQTLDAGVTPPGNGFDVIQQAGDVFVDDGTSLTPH
jgi:hypothetical protein